MPRPFPRPRPVSFVLACFRPSWRASGLLPEMIILPSAPPRVWTRLLPLILTSACERASVCESVCERARV